MSTDSHNRDSTVDFDIKTVPSPPLRREAMAPDESEQTRWNQLLTRGIGDYVLKGILGRGTFGTVYHAYDEKLNRAVAIKVLNNPLDADGLDLFKQEAQVIAALGKNANVVQIYQWGECDGCPYFVLEYIESSVSDLLRKFPKGLPPETALRIVGAAAGALAHAHQQGILHRDIKPANILMENEGHTVKLADFGLAHLQKPGTSDKGIMAGSPPYMSPEQIECRPLDGRADVFSLGVTLYQLLCGKLPFAGRTASELFQNIRQNLYQPIREMLPELDPAICAIVDKATAHHPEQRYENAGAMAEDIHRLLNPAAGAEELEAVKREMEVKSRRRAVLLAGASAAAVAIIALGFISIFGLGGAEDPVLAEAREHLDLGDYAGSEHLYRAILEQEPANSQALYGTAFARLFQGAPEDARALFESIADAPTLRLEGLAAVAASEDAEAARAAIEAAKSEGSSAYAEVLLARLDVLAQQHEAAVQRLEQLATTELHFRWQLREALQLLGQAYFGMGRMDRAAEQFAKLRELGGKQEQVAAAYLNLIDQQARAAQSEEMRAQIQRISEMMKNRPAIPAADPWTSRPLTVMIMPVGQPHTPFAVESGLGDLLPVLLAEEIARHTGIAVVDRQLLDAVLAEQELSAQLSSDSGQLQLGQVLGARLIIAPRFERFRGQDSIRLLAVDTETTERRPIDRVDITAEVQGEEELLATLLTKVQEMVTRQYPLQGRLYKKAEGPMINIGAATGLSQDLVFDVFQDPALPPLANASVTVSNVGAEAAEVRVEGLPLEAVPGEETQGLFVRRRAVGT